MSIYATVLHVEEDNGRPGPIGYRGSHVLPSDADPRAGWVEVAAIPGFIERDGRPPLSDVQHPYHPWLRLSVNGETVVLNRSQVRLLGAAVRQWLRQTS